MKGFAAIAVLALCHVAMGGKPNLGLPLQKALDKRITSRAFEQTIIDTIECVRGQMEVGWPDYGIPSFNPLIIEDLTVDIGAAGIEGASGSINIQETVFEGITGFVVSDVKGSIGLLPPSYTVGLALTFPRTVLDTKYKIELVSGDYELTGEGTLSFVANDFKAEVSLKATIIGGIALQYFTLVPSLGGLDSFEITGIRGDEELSAEISADILENAVSIIDELAPKISEIVGDTVMNLVNNGGGGEEGGFLSDLLDQCLGGESKL